VFTGVYKRKIRLVCLCVLTLSVAACGGTGGRLSTDQQPPTQSALQAPEYRLGEGDVIAVGDLLAGGRTPSEIAADAEVKLAQFVRAPKVSIIVKDLVSSEFQNHDSD